jgi:hypothetical protein
MKLLKNWLYDWNILLLNWKEKEDTSGGGG